MLGLLFSTPASVRAEFLQSLDFVNGRLVGATVGGVSTYLKPAEFEPIREGWSTSKRIASQDNWRTVQGQRLVIVQRP